MSIATVFKTTSVFSILALSLFAHSAHAGAARGELHDERVKRLALEQLVKDAEVVVVQQRQECGMDIEGSLALVKLKLPTGEVQTVKIYGVTEKRVTLNPITMLAQAVVPPKEVFTCAK